MESFHARPLSRRCRCRRRFSADMRPLLSQLEPECCSWPAAPAWLHSQQLSFLHGSCSRRAAVPAEISQPQLSLLFISIFTLSSFHFGFLIFRRFFADTASSAAEFRHRFSATD